MGLPSWGAEWCAFHLAGLYPVYQVRYLWENRSSGEDNYDHQLLSGGGRTQRSSPGGAASPDCMECQLCHTNRPHNLHPVHWPHLWIVPSEWGSSGQSTYGEPSLLQGPKQQQFQGRNYAVLRQFLPVFFQSHSWYPLLTSGAQS